MTLDYLAGLFDGEGTISLYRKNASQKFRAPWMEMTSTTQAHVQVMQNEFGGCIKTKRTKQAEHHKDSWIWAVQSDAAIAACEKLVDRILEPQKVARMRLILRDYKRLTVRNGRYTNEQMEAKISFEEEFFAL